MIVSVSPGSRSRSSSATLREGDKHRPLCRAHLQQEPVRIALLPQDLGLHPFTLPAHRLGEVRGYDDRSHRRSTYAQDDPGQEWSDENQPSSHRKLESLEAVVPHRGQWFQSRSNDAMQTGQALGAVGVSVEGLGGLGGSSSPASDTPFLNSFIDFPSEAASSGSFFAPKSKSTIARPTSRSWEPIIAVSPSGSSTPCASSG